MPSIEGPTDIPAVLDSEALWSVADHIGEQEEQQVEPLQHAAVPQSHLRMTVASKHGALCPSKGLTWVTNSIAVNTVNLSRLGFLHRRIQSTLSPPSYGAPGRHRAIQYNPRTSGLTRPS